MSQPTYYTPPAQFSPAQNIQVIYRPSTSHLATQALQTGMSANQHATCPLAATPPDPPPVFLPFSKGHCPRCPVTQVRTPGVVLTSSCSSPSTPTHPMAASGPNSVQVPGEVDMVASSPGCLGVSGLSSQSLTGQKAAQSQTNRDNWPSWKGGTLGGEGWPPGRNDTQRRDGTARAKAQNGGASVARVTECRAWGKEGEKGARERWAGTRSSRALRGTCPLRAAGF